MAKAALEKLIAQFELCETTAVELLARSAREIGWRMKALEWLFISERIRDKLIDYQPLANDKRCADILERADQLVTTAKQLRSRMYRPSNKNPAPQWARPPGSNAGRLKGRNGHAQKR
jgi:hypothetical protein